VLQIKLKLILPILTFVMISACATQPETRDDTQKIENPTIILSSNLKFKFKANPDNIIFRDKLIIIKNKNNGLLISVQRDIASNDVGDFDDAISINNLLYTIYDTKNIKPKKISDEHLKASRIAFGVGTDSAEILRKDNFDIFVSSDGESQHFAFIAEGDEVYLITYRGAAEGFKEFIESI